MQIRYTSEEDSIQNLYCMFHTNEDHTKEHHTNEDSNEGHLRTCRWLRRLHALARASSLPHHPPYCHRGRGRACCSRSCCGLTPSGSPATSPRPRGGNLAGKVQRRPSKLQGTRQGARGSGRGRGGKGEREGGREGGRGRVNDCERVVVLLKLRMSKHSISRSSMII